MNIKFPQTILRTAENWGNDFYYMTKKDMEKTVKDLQKLGDDWESASIDECAEFNFVSKSGKRAVYQRGTGKYSNHVFEKNKDGSFRLVNQY